MKLILLFALMMSYVCLYMCFVHSTNAISITDAMENYSLARDLHQQVTSLYKERYDVFEIYCSERLRNAYNETLKNLNNYSYTLDKTYSKLMSEYPTDKNWSDTAKDVIEMAKWLREYEGKSIFDLEKELREELENTYSLLVRTYTENRSIDTDILLMAKAKYNLSQDKWANSTPSTPIDAIKANYYLLEAINILYSTISKDEILNIINEVERLIMKFEQNANYARSIGLGNESIPWYLYQDALNKKKRANKELEMNNYLVALTYANNSLSSIKRANNILDVRIKERLERRGFCSKMGWFFLLIGALFVVIGMYFPLSTWLKKDKLGPTYDRKMEIAFKKFRKYLVIAIILFIVSVIFFLRC